MRTWILYANTWQDTDDSIGQGIVNASSVVLAMQEAADQFGAFSKAQQIADQLLELVPVLDSWADEWEHFVVETQLTILDSGQLSFNVKQKDPAYCEELSDLLSDLIFEIRNNPKFDAIKLTSGIG